jgi:hypothetical protein
LFRNVKEALLKQTLSKPLVTRKNEAASPVNSSLNKNGCSVGISSFTGLVPELKRDQHALE